MRSQLTKRGLLLATLLVGMYFICASFYDRWYNSTYSGFVGFERLADLEPGASFNSVSHHYLRSYQISAKDVVDLGPSQNGKVLLSGDSIYVSPSLVELIKDELADLESGDELHYFEAAHGGGSFLQFRNRKLVDHSPSTFQPTVRLATMNHYPVPGAILRFGVLPFYLPVAALLLYGYSRLHRRPNSPQSPGGMSHSAGLI